MARLEDDIENRIPVFLTSWEEWAKDESFAKMTLDEFRIRTTGPFGIRAEILALENKLDGKLAERDLADTKAAELLALVVSSIKGNPDFGPDCELYQALGYVRKSERKSGLTRKEKPVSVDPLKVDQRPVDEWADQGPPVRGSRRFFERAGAKVEERMGMSLLLSWHATALGRSAALSGNR